eukprot:3723665-Pyramimonas_sp.AAC.1
MCIRDRATTIDEAGHCNTMADADVFKHFHIPPMYIELKVRRLRTIQASVKHPPDYDQWLTA